MPSIIRTRRCAHATSSCSRTARASRCAALRPAPFMIRLPGPFNVANAMAAIGCACSPRLRRRGDRARSARVGAVPGRMTQVPAERIGVYVDYAHTPDGHAQRTARGARAHPTSTSCACSAAAATATRSSARVMGRIAREMADCIILTSDNPAARRSDAHHRRHLAGMSGEGGSYDVVPIAPKRSSAPSNSKRSPATWW